MASSVSSIFSVVLKLIQIESQQVSWQECVARLLVRRPITASSAKGVKPMVPDLLDLDLVDHLVAPALTPMASDASPMSPSKMWGSPAFNASAWVGLSLEHDLKVAHGRNAMDFFDVHDLNAARICIWTSLGISLSNMLFVLHLVAIVKWLFLFWNAGKGCRNIFESHEKVTKDEKFSTIRRDGDQILIFFNLLIFTKMVHILKSLDKL